MNSARILWAVKKIATEITVIFKANLWNSSSSTCFLVLLLRIVSKTYLDVVFCLRSMDTWVAGLNSAVFAVKVEVLLQTDPPPKALYRILVVSAIWRISTIKGNRIFWLCRRV